MGHNSDISHFIQHCFFSCIQAAAVFPYKSPYSPKKRLAFKAFGSFDNKADRIPENEKKYKFFVRMRPPD
jgi:hypothetical protein